MRCLGLEFKTMSNRKLIEELRALEDNLGDPCHPGLFARAADALEEYAQPKPAPDVVSVPGALADRIYSAFAAFISGRASIHVPPRQDDVDIVLAERLKPVKFLAEAPQPVAQDGWIPVSERLPESATDVLVYGVNHGSASYTVAGLFSGEWASQETEETTRFEPTHWMPLPAAPKGGE